MQIKPFIGNRQSVLTKKCIYTAYLFSEVGYGNSWQFFFSKLKQQATDLNSRLRSDL